MRHRFTRSVLRLSGLAAAATAGLLAVSTAASASGPASPVISALPNAAAAAAGPQTYTTSYNCDTSVLRLSQSAPSLGSFSFQVTLTAPAAGVVGQSAKVGLSVAAAPVPSVISAVLPALDSITLSATAPVNATAGPGVTFSAASGPVAAKATELPALTASGSLPLTAAGTATIASPPELRLALASAGKPYATLDCDGHVQESLKIKVTAPAPPVPTPPAGPDYTCALTANVPGVGSLPGFSGPVPFLASVAGNRTTGSTDVVSLAPNLGGESITGAFGDLDGLGIVGTAFAAEVPVTGAGHGAIEVSGKTVGLTSKIFTGAGRLYLPNPGTYHLLAPKAFTFAIIGPSVRIAGKTTTVTITMSCKLTSGTDSVLTRLTVTGKPVPASGSGGTTEGSGTAASGAVPGGAPNTGGGSAPGSALPLVLGGVALLLAGGGGTVFAVRRRRLSPPSA